MTAIKINPQEFIAYYLQGKHDELSECLLKVLENFSSVAVVEYDADIGQSINEFAWVFLYLFPKKQYIIRGFTMEGIEIEMIFTKNGDMKTAYPIID